MRRPKLTWQKRFWRALPLFLVLIVLLLLTAYAASTAANNNRDSAQNRVESYADQVSDELQFRLGMHAEILQGGVGLYNAVNGELTREAWQRYIDAFAVPSTMPGVVRIGYAQFVESADVGVFVENAARLTGDETYRIWPSSQANVFLPVLYSEPKVPGGVNAMGFDLLSDPVRSDAVQRACNDGSLSLSDPLGLLSDKPDEKDGLFLIAPLVDNSPRRCSGVLFLVMRTSSLFQTVVDNTKPNGVYMDIQSGQGADAKPVFSHGSKVDGKPYVQFTKPILMANQTWYMNFSASNEILTGNERNRPIATLIFGALFSILLFTFLVVALRNRAREIEYEHRLSVETTKEELLSLASHQLRTPATGVKQYAGMLLQGFAGDLPEEQNTLLQKAYDANERQLEIINQILHITRIETGSLELGRERIDLCSLIDDVVDEQQEAIETKHHSVMVELPKRSIYYEGDKFYLRMVLENLLSNAVKYTHKSGEIRVALSKRNGNVMIEVSDNGVGMSYDEQSLIFDKFTRIDNELSIEAGGSGIGLYLAKKIVELHGGTIQVESKPHEGTKFRVLLPHQKHINREEDA